MFKTLGKFEIVGLLGQGSMGEVYVGRDPLLGREVALKVIRPARDLGRDARERFAREARSAGSLNHPNIVTIHELGEDQGVLFLAMELVKGKTLEALIRDESLPPRELVEVLAQVCDGLSAAHRQQILHRDIKPANIKVLWDGPILLAKLLDFGVAKLLQTDTTSDGTVFGTVNYMAPEYLQSGRPDHRSDLFAVGVVLFEAIAGKPPFDGSSPGAIIYRLLHEPPPALPSHRLGDLHGELSPIFQRLVAKDPAHRFQSAEEVARALRASLGESAAPPVSAPAAIPAPAKPVAAPPDSGPRKLVLPRQEPTPEVQTEVLQETRRQLQKALAMAPLNPKTHALMLVTYYRLQAMDAFQEHMRQVMALQIPAQRLRETPRFRQLVEEEQKARTLPFEVHAEFMSWAGG